MLKIGVFVEFFSFFDDFQHFLKKFSIFFQLIFWQFWTGLLMLSILIKMD